MTHLHFDSKMTRGLQNRSLKLFTGLCALGKNKVCEFGLCRVYTSLAGSVLHEFYCNLSVEIRGCLKWRRGSDHLTHFEDH